MKKNEAAIVSAYTGILIGELSDYREYVETILGRAVLTHELGDPETMAEIKEKAKADFISIPIQ